MSVLTSVGILLLSALILAFLQLVPGIFALLLHFSSGKFSKNKASDFGTFFLLGAETSIILIFLFVYFILTSTPAIAYAVTDPLFAWIMAGILAALGLFFLCCYYRRGSGSELFISRNLAHKYRQKAATIKNRSDAFILGLIASVPELIFTLPLYILAVLQVNLLAPDSLTRASLIILFALIAILPLFILHATASHGYNLADFLKFRFKNRQFFRFAITLFYLFIIILIILGVVL